MNILLIRLRLIGDVVFTTPIIRALKGAFPDARLTYLVEPEAAPIVARNPHLAEVVIAPKTQGWKRWRDDLRLARKLRAARFDIVIDLHGGPRSSWLTRATGAPRRIGYDVKGRSWQYTKTVHRPPDLRARHSVENQWDLLGAIDGCFTDAPSRTDDHVEMSVDPDADARVALRLADAGVTPAETLIVVHVSAGNPFRRWPEPAFIRLVASMAAAGQDRRLVVSSGPSDSGAAERIVRGARAQLGAVGESRVLDIGEFDLAELRSLVGRSRLYIGGDTGPLHIAATTATPIVAIYGPTLPERSAPWRDPSIPTEAVQVDGLPCRPCDQRLCAPGDFRCLTTLTPGDVISAAERALRRSA